MRKLLFALFITCSTLVSAQNINDNQRSPYIETYATADSLVVPDRIYMKIRLDERDSKGKVSVEELEKRMSSALESAGVNLEKQLSLGNLGSDFSKYFLRKKDVSKEKVYELVVYSAKKLSEVLINLEKVKISNINLTKVEYSKTEELKLLLRQKAVSKALTQAKNLVKPLNQQVGKAIAINDINNGGFFNQNARLDEVVVRRNYSRKKIADKIEFKKIKVTSSVRIRFHLY